MNSYTFLIILIAILSIILLIYFVCLAKLRKYKDIMLKTEDIINNSLNDKAEIIANINTSIKKVAEKKDYLKDYIKINDLKISNIEKDMKLDEAFKLIKDLMEDFENLNKDKEFKNNIKKLKELDEVLVSAKSLYNKNATKNNNLIKNFPYTLVAKFSNYSIKSLYNNKTDDGDNF